MSNIIVESVPASQTGVGQWDERQHTGPSADRLRGSDIDGDPRWNAHRTYPEGSGYTHGFLLLLIAAHSPPECSLIRLLAATFRDTRDDGRVVVRNGRSCARGRRDVWRSNSDDNPHPRRDAAATAND